MTDLGDLVACELVTVTIEDEDGNQSRHTVPAHTRPRSEFRELVLDILDTYMGAGEETMSPASMGDFALFLIAVAESEPRVQ